MMDSQVRTLHRSLMSVTLMQGFLLKNKKNQESSRGQTPLILKSSTEDQARGTTLTQDAQSTL